MKKNWWYFLAFLLYLLFTMFLMEPTDTNMQTVLASDSIPYGIEIQYSLSDYCIDPVKCTNKMTVIPQRLWIERSGGYAGYIPIDSYYRSPTHWVVYYWGILPKAPYGPDQIDEDIAKENRSEKN